MVFYNYVSLKNKKDSMIGMRRLFVIVCFMVSCACISAAEDIKPVSFTKVHVNDKFWRQRLDVLRKNGTRNTNRRKATKKHKPRRNCVMRQNAQTQPKRF